MAAPKYTVFSFVLIVSLFLLPPIWATEVSLISDDYDATPSPQTLTSSPATSSNNNDPLSSIPSSNNPTTSTKSYADYVTPDPESTVMTDLSQGSSLPINDTLQNIETSLEDITRSKRPTACQVVTGGTLGAVLAIPTASVIVPGTIIALNKTAIVTLDQVPRDSWWYPVVWGLAPVGVAAILTYQGVKTLFNRPPPDVREAINKATHREHSHLKTGIYSTVQVCEMLFWVGFWWSFIDDVESNLDPDWQPLIWKAVFTGLMIPLIFYNFVYKSNNVTKDIFPCGKGPEEKKHDAFVKSFCELTTDVSLAIKEGISPETQNLSRSYSVNTALRAVTLSKAEDETSSETEEALKKEESEEKENSSEQAKTLEKENLLKREKDREEGPVRQRASINKDFLMESNKEAEATTTIQAKYIAVIEMSKQVAQKLTPSTKNSYVRKKKVAEILSYGVAIASLPMELVLVYALQLRNYLKYTKLPVNTAADISTSTTIGFAIPKIPASAKERPLIEREVLQLLQGYQPHHTTNYGEDRSYIRRVMDSIFDRAAPLFDRLFVFYQVALPIANFSNEVLLDRDLLSGVLFDDPTMRWALISPFVAVVWCTAAQLCEPAFETVQNWFKTGMKVSFPAFNSKWYNKYFKRPTWSFKGCQIKCCPCVDPDGLIEEELTTGGRNNELTEKTKEFNHEHLKTFVRPLKIESEIQPFLQHTDRGDLHRTVR